MSIASSSREIPDFECLAFLLCCSGRGGGLRLCQTIAGQKNLSRFTLPPCKAADMTLRFVISAILAAILFAGEASGRDLLDSGFPSDERAQPFWIDNDRIVFKGFAVGSYSKEMHEAPSQARAQGYDTHGMRTGYYVWDIATSKVSLYKDRIANLCIEDDRVVYQTITTTDDQKPVVWRGKFGGEQPTTIEPLRWTLPEMRATCWGAPIANPRAQKGRYAIPLRADWGYLDVGPRDPPLDLKAPVSYHRNGQSTPIKLAIPMAKLRNGGYALFAPFDQQHLIVEGLRNASQTPDAWFLTREGVLTKVTLPEGPWLGVKLYPVKDGIFLSSAYTKGKKISEPGGAYLVSAGEPWRLLFSGVKGRAGVSPDGCKVALTFSPDEKAHLESFRELIAGRPGEKTMRVIDLCRRSR